MFTTVCQLEVCIEAKKEKFEIWFDSQTLSERDKAVFVRSVWGKVEKIASKDGLTVQYSNNIEGPIQSVFSRAGFVFF